MSAVSDIERLNAFKRGLHQDNTARKRLFEAETGLVVKDIELVFVDVSALDDPRHLLSEVQVTM